MMKVAVFSEELSSHSFNICKLLSGPSCVVNKMEHLTCTLCILCVFVVKHRESCKNKAIYRCRHHGIAQTWFPFNMSYILKLS